MPTWSCSTPAASARTPTTSSTATSASSRRSSSAGPTCRSWSAAAWPRRTATSSSSGRPTSTWCSAPTTSHRAAELLGEQRTRRPVDGRDPGGDGRRRPRVVPERAAGAPGGALRRAGSRSRSGATTRAPSASCPRCGAARSAGRSTTSSARSRALAADGVTEVTLLGPEREQLRPRPHAGPAAGRRGGAGPAAVRRPAAGRGRRSTASAGSATPAPTPRTCAPRPSRRWPRCPEVCEHLHLPLQAGSDRVLAAMHRGYTAERYLERLAAARAAMPDLAVTTDIIVGFPGETDDDFERTLEVVAEAGYDSAYTFIFSPRPGHRGRRTRSTSSCRPRSRASASSACGSWSSARPWPATGPGSGGSRRSWSRARPARTPRSRPAAPSTTSWSTSGTAEPLRPGTYARVRVTGAAPHHLTGELVGGHRPGPPPDPHPGGGRVTSGTGGPPGAPGTAVGDRAASRTTAPTAAGAGGGLMADIDERYAADGAGGRRRSRGGGRLDRAARAGHAARRGRSSWPASTASRWAAARCGRCSAAPPDVGGDQAHVHASRGPAPRRQPGAARPARGRGCGVGYRRVQLETGRASPRPSRSTRPPATTASPPYGQYEGDELSRLLRQGPARRLSVGSGAAQTDP